MAARIISVVSILFIMASFTGMLLGSLNDFQIHKCSLPENRTNQTNATDSSYENRTMRFENVSIVTDWNQRLLVEDMGRATESLMARMKSNVAHNYWHKQKTDQYGAVRTVVGQIQRFLV